MQVRLLLLFLSLVALAGPVGAAPFGETRQYFRNWLTACRADGYCSATAYVKAHPGSAAVADYVLRVGRHARQTYWEISFTTVATQGDDRAPLTAEVDGKSLTFTPPEDVGPFGSVNDFFLLGRKAQTVLDRLVPGKRLTFGFTDMTGTPRETSFALQGLAQALIWIDTAQHRIGAERVAEAPPHGLFRTDVPGATWMRPALAADE